MIRKNPYGVSPTLRVAIDGASVDYLSIENVELHLEENLHDMAVITMVGLPTRASAAYRNRPVELSIDNGGFYLAQFHGYVVDVRPSAQTASGLVNGSPFQTAKLVCLGASYMMRGAKHAQWSGQTLQDVAFTFGTKYGFSVDAPTTPLVFDTMIQSGESDWQFLVRYAGMLGYSATVHSTHLHIFDPYKAAGRQLSFNKLKTAKAIAAESVAHPGQITQFEACLTNDHPDGTYKDTVVTVHDSSGEVFDVSLRELRGLSTTPLFSDRLAGSADNYEEAKRVIDAHVKEHYDFRATVEVLGVAGCKPGGVVDVDRYSSEMDGMWYVHGLKHYLSSGVFSSTLELRRNIISELENDKTLSVVQVPPSSKLEDGKWITSKKVLNAFS